MMNKKEEIIKRLNELEMKKTTKEHIAEFTKFIGEAETLAENESLNEIQAKEEKRISKNYTRKILNRKYEELILKIYEKEDLKKARKISELIDEIKKSGDEIFNILDEKKEKTILQKTKEKIKEKTENAKELIKEHKKKIIIATAGAGIATAGAAIVYVNKDKLKKKPEKKRFWKKNK